ncbi:MAG: carboxypeptidase-like regulatory domain-containing protein [Cytophagales bacterium]|nr:carboxypeptidase-like regulatory domain-containing protein [Cytophagales bacterium]
MRYLLFLILVLPVTGFGQYTLTVTVKDAEDLKPVPYATVLFPAQDYAFSANGNGRFVLKVNTMEMDRAVVISSIGYDEYRTTLGAMVEGGITEVFLSPKVTMLEEVLVKAEKETAKELVEEASKRLREYLKEDPYYLYAFYRETLKQDQQFVGFTEAYGVLHIPGYQPSYNKKNRLFSYDLAQWKNIRRSHYKVRTTCDTAGHVLDIHKLLKAKSEYLYNGPLSKKIKEFTYSIDSLTSYRGNDVFIVGFQSPGREEDYRGHILIKADDYAVMGLRVVHSNLGALLGLDCHELDSSQFEVTFTTVGERYYLNTLSLTMSGRIGGQMREKKLRLRGGEFKANKIQKLNYDQRMVIYQEMINPVIHYDPSFWEQNGDDIEVSLAEDLGENEPLAQQFFKWDGQRIVPLPDNFDTYEELYKNEDIFRLFMNNQ